MCIACSGGRAQHGCMATGLGTRTSARPDSARTVWCNGMPMAAAGRGLRLTDFTTTRSTHATMPANPRRILLVSWHFPPSSEIAGKIVWRLARQLALAGCEVRVLAPPLDEIGDRDEAYARELPANLRITRSAVGTDPVRALANWRQRLKRWRDTDRGTQHGAQPAVEPAAVTGGDGPRRRLLEAVQMLPDRARHWMAPATRTLRRILREERPDV